MYLNVGEFGRDFLFGTDEDISAYTYEILVIYPDGTTATWIPFLGTADTTYCGISYIANQYVVYKFKDGDLPQEGKHSARLFVMDGSALKLKTDWQMFSVDP